MAARLDMASRLFIDNMYYYRSCFKCQFHCTETFLCKVCLCGLDQVRRWCVCCDMHPSMSCHTACVSCYYKYVSPLLPHLTICISCNQAPPALHHIYCQQCIYQKQAKSKHVTQIVGINYEWDEPVVNAMRQYLR